MQWIKGTDRVPTDHSRYFIKIEGTMSIGHWSKHHEMFINESNDFFPEDQIEWLDESPPPPADIVAEAQAVAQRRFDSTVADTVSIEACIEYYKEAHISCAQSYEQKVKGLEARGQKLIDWVAEREKSFEAGANFRRNNKAYNAKLSFIKELKVMLENCGITQYNQQPDSDTLKEQV